MNLQNLGVQEMNAKELVAVDGGGFWDNVAWAASHYIAFGANFADSFADGFEAGSNQVIEAHNNMYH